MKIEEIRQKIAKRDRIPRSWYSRREESLNSILNLILDEIEGLCNGSTHGSEPCSGGSNPPPPANRPKTV